MNFYYSVHIGTIIFCESPSLLQKTTLKQRIKASNFSSIPDGFVYSILFVNLNLSSVT